MEKNVIYFLIMKMELWKLDKDKIIVFDLKNYIYGITFYLFDIDLNLIYRGTEKFRHEESVEECCERILNSYDAKYFSFKDGEKKYLGLIDILSTKNYSLYKM